MRTGEAQSPTQRRPVGSSLNFTHPLFPILLFLLLASLQLLVFVQGKPESGAWFLYGRDTLAHDAVAHLWVQQWMETLPGVVPLWIAEIQGGVPTLGSFFWTPFAPGALPLYLFDYPTAQRLGWILSLWVAGIGAYLLGRSVPLRREAAAVTGAVWMLCGHVVTLIHAGHFQKVMALGWLPWMVAGAVLLARRRSIAGITRGTALAALGLGMMFLSGHPQIAYLGLMMSGLVLAFALLFDAATRRQWVSRCGSFAAMILLGAAFGGAQLVPGLEMSSLSNRAGGVGIEEAVATSYPPGELLEFVIPRVKGSSVFGDEYTGEWGERIVSDFISKTAVAMAIVGLVLGWRRWLVGRHGAWLFCAMLFLLIGVGRHSPFYRGLYDWLPGFSSFRSPGTFMAGTSLALAVLAGHGVVRAAALLNRRHGPLSNLAFAGVTLFVICLELLPANRHFLYSFSWDRYRVEFLEPTSLDTALGSPEYQLNVHDPVSEMSLRPILFGRRVLNAYHPISLGKKLQRDAALGFNTHDWFAAWGFTYLLLPLNAQTGEGLTELQRFDGAGRKLAALAGASRFVEPPPGSTAQWVKREPNERVLMVEQPAAGTVHVRESVAPGWLILRNGVLERQVSEVALETKLEVPAGSHQIEWRYRPLPYSLGLFTTALAAGAIAFVYTATRRSRSRSVPVSSLPR